MAVEIASLMRTGSRCRSLAFEERDCVMLMGCSTYETMDTDEELIDIGVTTAFLLVSMLPVFNVTCHLSTPGTLRWEMSWQILVREMFFEFVSDRKNISRKCSA